MSAFDWKYEGNYTGPAKKPIEQEPRPQPPANSNHQDRDPKPTNPPKPLYNPFDPFGYTRS